MLLDLIETRALDQIKFKVLPDFTHINYYCTLKDPAIKEKALLLEKEINIPFSRTFSLLTLELKRCRSRFTI